MGKKTLHLHGSIASADKVMTAMDTNEFVLGIFLRFFQGLHDILISKVKFDGFYDQTLKWLHSYVSNREQYVCFNGSVSNRKRLTCGVPQGSLLGPLLFIIYIIDFSTIASSYFHILFVDDTNLILTHKDLKSLICEAHLAMKTVSQ